MKTLSTIMILMIAMLFSSQSFAYGYGGGSAGGDGVLFGVGFLKFDKKTEGPNFTNSDVTNTYYDLKLGYVSSNLYLGGLYSIANNDSNGSTNKRTGLGATVGYHNEGFILDFSYFLQAEDQIGSTTFQKGSGYAFDFGYNYMMTSNFYMGLELSYKSFAFKELETGGAVSSADNKIVSELYPMINLGFMF